MALRLLNDVICVPRTLLLMATALGLSDGLGAVALLIGAVGAFRGFMRFRHRYLTSDGKPIALGLVLGDRRIDALFDCLIGPLGCCALFPMLAADAGQANVFGRVAILTGAVLAAAFLWAGARLAIRSGANKGGSK